MAGETPLLLGGLVSLDLAPILGQMLLVAAHSETDAAALDLVCQVFDFLDTIHIWEAFLYPPPEEAPGNCSRKMSLPSCSRIQGNPPSTLTYKTGFNEKCC